MLHLSEITKTHTGFKLNGISLEVGQGEYFVLLGPSGSGKTLLFEIIAGMVRQDSGKILLGGRDISHSAPQKRKIGLVFQENALFPHLTVRKNIAYPLRIQGLEKHTIRERVHRLAEEFSVAHLLDRMTGSLSGGEKQRVSIARSIAHNPECLLLDEPLSSLDTVLREEIRNLMSEVNKKGMTILHITHDHREAFYLADRIAVIRNGTIIRCDRKEEIRKNPGSRHVAELIGYRNIFTYRHSVTGLQIEGVTVPFESYRGPGQGQLIIPDEAVILGTEGKSPAIHHAISGIILETASLPGYTEMLVDIGIRIRKTAQITARSFHSKDRVTVFLDPAMFIFL
ncbi:MAG: ABC transporter ATP-binding protein [Bacteroidales bacterium]|nr:ABC transporter ATP-binding protein [Bacteroidales bacterium]